MFKNDVIKIKYIDEGYLPNYAYHQITDREMIDAFLAESTGYFDDKYGIDLKDEELIEALSSLKDAVKFHLSAYLDEGVPIPDWVYSYMLGNTVGPSSEEADVNDLAVLIGYEDLTNFYFDEDIARDCLAISKDWVKKMLSKASMRPPTIFGEPHVIKSLRLRDANILT